MKQWASIFIVMLGLWATGLYADQTMNQSSGEAYKQMMEKLNLTDQQKPEVEKILKNNRQELKELRNEDSSRFSKLQDLRETSKETEDKLSKVLDAKQMEEYLKLRGQMRAELKKRHQENKSN